MSAKSGGFQIPVDRKQGSSCVCVCVFTYTFLYSIRVIALSTVT